jgi:hypothetical protein
MQAVTAAPQTVYFAAVSAPVNQATMDDALVKAAGILDRRKK